ncbi:MAG: lipid-A-disaccharide synthase [Rhodospirillaceae bacterium]|nr:MAG: lipid-A-disaccharide synthase [Rhodospirillaceae bacterium]
MEAKPLIYIVAGEPSGDLLGARLMAALRREAGGNVCFAGVGGENMAGEGLSSLFDLADIAVMGFWEVLPRVPRVLRRVRETVADIARRRPAVLVTIDSWGFTGRINRAVRALDLPLAQIHYVAPMVWAWGERRAARMAGSIDHLMTLFPHEPAYFERVGVLATWVGHPVIEGSTGDGPAFRHRHAIAETAPVLCVLPGSRQGEVKRLLPVLAETVRRLVLCRPDLRVVVPTVATVAETVAAAVRNWPGPPVMVFADKYDAFAAADMALAASGTVVLELALAEVPMVVTYTVSPVSAWLFRRLSRVGFVTLINLLVDRLVVPEFLQERCRPDLLAEAVETLFDSASARAIQQAGCREALARLGGGGGAPSPSIRAARLVLERALKTP